MADTIEISGNEYRIGKMPVMIKFHVARRLSPVLSSVFQSGGDKAVPGATLGGITEAVARMPQEDADFVINHCLGVVEIMQGDRPAKVMRNGSLMFEMIDLPEMMQLVMAALTENLGAFFPASGSTSTGGAAISPTSILSPSPTT